MKQNKEKFNKYLKKIEVLKGIKQNKRNHNLDAYSHSVKAFELALNNDEDDDVLISLILHDIGKSTTYEYKGNGKHIFPDHPKASYDICKKFLSNDKQLWLILNHDEFLSNKKMNEIKNKKGLDYLRDLVLVQIYDNLAHNQRSIERKKPYFNRINTQLRNLEESENDKKIEKVLNEFDLNIMGYTEVDGIIKVIVLPDLDDINSGYNLNLSTTQNDLIIDFIDFRTFMEKIDSFDFYYINILMNLKSIKNKELKDSIIKEVLDLKFKNKNLIFKSILNELKKIGLSIKLYGTERDKILEKTLRLRHFMSKYLDGDDFNECFNIDYMKDKYYLQFKDELTIEKVLVDIEKMKYSFIKKLNMNFDKIEL